jgi:hypothetical protein
MNRVSRHDRKDGGGEFGLPAWQVAGFSVLFTALLALLFLFPGQVELILGAMVAAAGAGKLVIGHLEAGENDALPPASREFRQLADPKRPLPPPTSPLLSEERPTSSADPST